MIGLGAMDDVLVKVGKFAATLIIPAFVGGISVITFMNSNYVTKTEFMDHKANTPNQVSKDEYQNHVRKDELIDSKIDTLIHQQSLTQADVAFLKGYILSKGVKTPHAGP